MAKHLQIQPKYGLLTNSMLRTWRSCPYKAHVEYEQGWAPVREADALHLGTLVHLGLEAWWKAIVCTRDAEFVAAQSFTEQDIEFWPYFEAIAAVEGRARDPFVQVAVEEMLRGYHMQWRWEADEYEILRVEEYFEVPLWNPETDRTSRTFGLGGKYDGALMKVRDGRAYVLEHKTSSENVSDPSSSYFVKLSIDPQCSFYAIGATADGIDVAGTIYDVLRKPTKIPLKATPPEKRQYRARKKAKPGKPERTIKSGKRKGEVIPATPAEEGEEHLPEDHPSLLYASQRLEDETPEEYRLRIRADYEEDPGKWFVQRVVPRTHGQMQEFLRQTWMEGQIIATQRKHGLHTRNPAACHLFSECWLWAHCTAGERLQDHPDRYRRKEVPHEELHGDQTLPAQEGAAS